jgi:hypothetical protein
LARPDSDPLVQLGITGANRAHERNQDRDLPGRGSHAQLVAPEADLGSGVDVDRVNRAFQSSLGQLALEPGGQMRIIHGCSFDAPSQIS